MIWESAPWKDGLLKDASLLERWASKTSKPTQRHLIFEKKVFLAAYAVRKLFEADKVCAVLHERPVPCFSYPRTDSDLTELNWDRLEEHFNWDAGAPTHLSATALMNQIIHSFIFMLRVDESDHVDGFLVVSRQGKRRLLFSVGLQDFLELMREVGHDFPSQMERARDVEVQWRSISTCSSQTGEDHSAGSEATT
jgi:hypothetical protein